MGISGTSVVWAFSPSAIDATTIYGGDHGGNKQEHIASDGSLTHEPIAPKQVCSYLGPILLSTSEQVHHRSG